VTVVRQADPQRMETRIVIFGAGGLGREVLQVIRDQQRSGGRVECVGFLVDLDFAGPTIVNGIAVFRDITALAKDSSVRFIVAVGNSAKRARIAERIQLTVGPRFATIVHPSSILGDNVSIESGSIIMPLASITTDVRIGGHVLINPHVSIAHDCLLEDYVSLSPAATLAGGVHLEQGCEIGSGATVIPRQRVGRWSRVGAGAVVIRSVAAHTTVVGVPARQVADRNDN
jgi:sugar O-acyltransferase (sialic acid O-acetyltransferase NeuD family)